MAEYRKLDDVRIKNTKFIWKTNFSGLVNDCNEHGYRRFNIEIPEEIALDMQEEGWPVRYKPRKKGGDEMVYVMDCRVRFDKFPPDIYMMVDNKKIRLTESSIGRLDGKRTGRVDVVLNPYYYNKMNNSGYTAYVKKMMVEVIQDDFERDYGINDIDDDGDDDMPWSVEE